MLRSLKALCCGSVEATNIRINFVAEGDGVFRDKQLFSILRIGYLRTKYRAEEGLPVVSKRFKSVALTARHRLQTELDAGAGKKVYKDYVAAIDNYLVPFFGQHNITGIDYALMKQYAVWRKKQMGREAQEVDEANDDKFVQPKRKAKQPLKLVASSGKRLVPQKKSK